ncbi:MAG: hypothetical protein ACW9W4_08030 [Candidatus Nitrosopumilus sp. bin_7KS]
MRPTPSPHPLFSTYDLANFSTTINPPVYFLPVSSGGKLVEMTYVNLPIYVGTND